VDAAVACGLSKLAADRFASATEFAEALTGARLVTRASSSGFRSDGESGRGSTMSGVTSLVGSSKLHSAGDP
jgi:hypothetical protein